LSHPTSKIPEGSENSHNVTHFGIPSGFARIFILTGICECICVRSVYHFFVNSLSLLTLNDKAYVTYSTAIDITNDTFIFINYSVFCDIIYDTAI